MAASKRFLGVLGAFAVSLCLVSARALATVEHSEAARYFKMRAFSEAERRYSVLVARDPGDLVAQLGVADAIAKQGDFERAAASYQAFVDLAVALPAKAREKWQADIARASNAAGVAALEVGRVDDAIQALDRAVRETPAGAREAGLYRANLAFARVVVAARAPRRQDGGSATADASFSDNLAKVPATDTAFSLLSVWRSLMDAALKDPKDLVTGPDRVKLCRPHVEPRTAGLVFAVDAIVRALAKGVPANVSIVVCERDAIEIDAEVTRAGGRRHAVFVSARDPSGLREALGRVVSRAAGAK